MNRVKKRKMPKQKSKSATIGFWLVLGASKEHSLLVCPALIKEEAVDKIESVSIQDAWTVQVQVPIDAHKDTIMVMIPEIINISNLDKEIGDYENLWKVDSVKAKCESLVTKYIEQFRLSNK